MNKTIKTFWGNVEIVEVTKTICKAILNGNELCTFRCSINDTEEVITKKFNKAIDNMKKKAFYN